MAATTGGDGEFVNREKNMGTNYYLYEKPDCPHCDRPFDSLHIGKSSAGWCFSLRIHPTENINSLADWQERWSRDGAKIKNEYGDVIAPDEMFSEITDRSLGNTQPITSPLWFEQNNAVPGPNGLARHRINGRLCVGYGLGPYDIMEGEFS